MTVWRDKQRAERRIIEHKLRGRVLRAMPPSQRTNAARIERLMARVLTAGCGNAITGVRALQAAGTITEQEATTALEVHRAWAVSKMQKADNAEAKFAQGLPLDAEEQQLLVTRANFERARAQEPTE